MTAGTSYLFEVDIEIIGENLQINPNLSEFQSQGGSLKLTAPNKIIIQMVNSAGSVCFGIWSADSEIEQCIIECYVKFGGLNIPIPEVKILLQDGLACEVTLVSADIQSKKYSYTINVSKTHVHDFKWVSGQ